MIGNLEVKSKLEWGIWKNHFNLQKSQIWTILNKVKGNYLSSVTTVVTLDGSGGREGSCGWFAQK